MQLNEQLVTAPVLAGLGLDEAIVPAVSTGAGENNEAIAPAVSTSLFGFNAIEPVVSGLVL